MDNMRHLSTSLPGARRTPPQELLSDFKAAALSVTNLYKAAANAQTQSRAAGYQDALEDLLTFLDSENLGLMDGEGWRVRQWATARLDEGTQRQASDDDEEASREDMPETRSSSPEAQRKPPTQPTSTDDLPGDLSQVRVASEPPPASTTHTQTTTTPSRPQAEFTFTSKVPYPEKEAGSMEVDPAVTSSTPTSTETVRILPRNSRRANNNSSNNNRQRGENRSTLNLNLGAGAGNKRKMPYPDFFDISGINFNFDGSDKKDGGRGGKRGRFV